MRDGGKGDKQRPLGVPEEQFNSNWDVIFKKKTNEHGYCPNCNLDLDGGSIWEHFYKEHGSEAEADRLAAMYGATKEKGQWGRQIGIYSMDQDRTVAHQCPECKHEWRIL